MSKRCYSGKKKKHTLKQQLLVDFKTRQILCTAGCEGKTHDFKLFQESGISLSKTCWLLVDSGYQGIQKLIENVLLPKKKSKHDPLTKQDKAYNKLLSQARILVQKQEKTIPAKIQPHRSNLQSRNLVLKEVY